MDKSLMEIIDDAVAIIGMAGRFPGANNIKQFWKNISEGKESITFFSDEELKAGGISLSEINDPSYVKARGLIKDIDKFDAKFFNILPVDAVVLDPQNRIILECAWSALEDAGYASEEKAGRVGVFTGCGFNTYYPKIILNNPEFAKSVGDINAALGNGNDYFSTRISYKLNLTGPSITVQTACSSSLVAIWLAYNNLINYQCDMAIAGGASAFFPIQSGYQYKKEFILSADGHCRALDAKGTGTVFGMGVGVVILKRLSDAIHDRDHIYAVIRGAAVNNDGITKVGFTAPNQTGQAEVIEEALTLAQINSSSIGYIEAHATGTPIGDPIEIAALTEIFSKENNEKNFCALGTLKSNIGHLDAAAGVAGLIKAALVLQNKKIPPAINFTEPNPKINFSDSPFYVPTKLEEWESGPRRAGVSSFGVGGTNAHVILEEAPTPDPRPSGAQLKPYYLITLSARSDKALEQRLLDLEHWLKNKINENSFLLEDLSFTLNLGRKHFEKRIALVVNSEKDLLDKLVEKNKGGTPSGFFSDQNLTSISQSAAELIEELETNQAVDAEGYRDTLYSLAQLFVKGEVINWDELHQHETPHRISIPTYPFERTRYWVPDKKQSHDVLNYYSPVWKKIDLNSIDYTNDSIIIVNNNTSLQIKNEFLSIDTFSLSEFNLTDPLPKHILMYADFESDNTDQSIEMSFYSVLTLLKKILQTKPKEPINLTFVYRANNLESNLFFESLSGLLKTIHLEHPIIRTKLVSVDSEELNLDFLNSDFDEMKCENGNFFAKVLSPLLLPDNNNLPFKKNGVYLITGGAKGVGKIIASYLQENFQARLILVGRSKIETSLENSFYQQCDISNKDGVEKVLNFCRDKFGTIDGIIHCAGVIHDSLLLQKSNNSIKEIFSAKISGTLLIDELTRHDKLDCFILFSSLAGIFGNLGQGDYAYANSFLNAFAQRRNSLVSTGARSGKTISINWPPWEEGGMQITKSARDWLSKNFDAVPLTNDHGLTAFAKAISSNVSNIVLMPGNKEKIQTLIQPIVKKTYQAPKNENDIIKNLIQQLAEVTQLATKDIDENTSLFDMGLDSIVLAQLISRVESEYQISLEDVIQEILMMPTLKNISQFIMQVKENKVSKKESSSYSDQIVPLNKKNS